MKNTMFLIKPMLAIVCLSVSCTHIDRDCRNDYLFVVSNTTDRPITISNNFTKGDTGTVILSKNQNETVYREGVWISGCGDTTLGDKYLADEHILPVQDDYTVVDESSRIFRMFIEDKAVSDDIWLRKYWSFTIGSDTEESVYILNITDELLASLPEAE